MKNIGKSRYHYCARKIPYTQAQAERAADRIHGSPYRCVSCGSWHVTSHGPLKPGPEIESLFVESTLQEHQ